MLSRNIEECLLILAADDLGPLFCRADGGIQHQIRHLRIELRTGAVGQDKLPSAVCTVSAGPAHRTGCADLPHPLL